MSILEISKPPRLLWVGASAATALLSLALGIAVGPKGVFVVSSFGLLLAVVGFILHRKQWLPLVMISIHVIFLGIALMLRALFLQPLSDEDLQIPRLAQTYQDPKGFFSVKIPLEWIAEPILTPSEAGVRIHPANRQQYMGISEMTVRIRELENKATHPVEFLKKIAEALSIKPKKERTLFNFSTEPTTLLNGDQGIWSRLLVKRFWIPLYQRALFGLKEKRYLCTVSTSGIEAHSTLAEVLCLGVFQTIEVHPRVKLKKRPENTAQSGYN